MIQNNDWIVLNIQEAAQGLRILVVWQYQRARGYWHMGLPSLC